MPAKQSLVWLYGKYYSPRAVSVSPRVRMPVLAWRVTRVRVHPRFSHVQSFDFVLGKVAKGNRRINKRCRLRSAVVWVRTRSRGSRGREKVDALQSAVFVQS